jgi:subtilisin
MKLRTHKKYLTTLILAAVASTSAFADEKINVIVKLKNTQAPFSSMMQKRSIPAIRRQSEQRRSAVQRFVKKSKIQAKHVYNSVYYGFSASVTPQEMEALKNDPNVAAVFPDKILHIVDIPDGYRPHLTSKKQRAIVDWPQVVPQGPRDSGAIHSKYKGKGQHVYVIDTGIDVTQNDIKNNLGRSQAMEVCSNYCDSDYDDDNQHGTHVAGTIAAANNTINSVGMAPEATVHAVKVCNGEGSCPTSSILGGLNWAVSNMIARGEPAIANLSLGGTDKSDKGICNETGYKGNHPVAETYCNAAHAGMVIVVAAGNDADDAKNYAPAGYDSTITVSSYTSYDAKKDEAVFTGFSNYGDTVSIAAPGRSIVSLNRHHAVSTLSGTSMAAPSVAGAAALIMEKYSQNMGFSAFLNIRQMLIDNAIQPGSVSVDDKSQSPHKEGLLNVRFLDK